MANIKDLMKQAAELRAKEAKLKAEMKQQKVALAKEYQSNMDSDTIKQQIAECEKVLTTAKAEFTTALQVLKTSYRERVAFAKEFLAFVNHKVSNGLPRVENSISVSGNIATIERKGLQPISVDTSKEHWQKTLIDELAKQGVDNGAGRNIAYKASLLVKSNA